MCGIVGYIGEQNAKDVIIKGLERLEYRGYDSSGIAIHEPNASVVVKKSVGKLNALKAHIEPFRLDGKRAIGHTRWATHGAPSDINAHPHKYGYVTVVHNGIIENYAQLKQHYLQLGHIFSSATDTEVVAHVLFDLLQEGQDILCALKSLGQILHGAYSLGIMLDHDQSRIFFIKNGTPLVVGLGNDEAFFASDQVALVDYIPDVGILEDGDYGFISKQEARVFDHSGALKHLSLKPLTAEVHAMEKMGHEHFMHKEIFEQPEVIERVLLGRIKNDMLNLDGFALNFDRIKKVKRIHIVACGSSYFAGLIARPKLEATLGLPVDVEIASEYRYRTTLTDALTLVIAISQSGETADTLAALNKAVSHGAVCMSVCNVVGSAIARCCEYSGGNLYLNAGPEISVASTKAFIAQVAALKLLTLAFEKTFSPSGIYDEATKVRGLSKLKDAIKQVLMLDASISDLAQSLINEPRMLFLGRGELLPVAFEGALKMKELSYIFAEGYPAGELKHGPIAIIEQGTPVVMAFSSDALQIKTLSNLSEVKARGAYVIAVAPQSADQVKAAADYFIALPECAPELLPILATIPLQLLAYHLSNHKGIDVDKPRNLAKSVTVE